MTQRTMLILATIITAFGLVVIGGVVGRVASNEDVAEGSENVDAMVAGEEGVSEDMVIDAPSESVPVDEQVVDGDVAGLQAIVDEREAAYRAALEEANRQLEEANNRQRELSEQLVEVQQAEAASVATAVPVVPTVLSAVVVAAPAASSGGQIGVEQAREIAFRYLGGGEVKEVELEEERGVLVYEVKFERGDKVYVEAATGQVVHAELEDDEWDDEREDDDGDDEREDDDQDDDD